MKKTMVLFAAIAALSLAPAWADQGQGPNLKERLGLTDEQAEKVMPIMQEFREKAQALREKAGAQQPTEEMREEFRKLREERDTKLKAILTADQFARFQEMMSQYGGRQGQQNKPPSGERQDPPPGERHEGPPSGQQDRAAMMKEKLGLTDEQAEKVKAVMKEFHEKAQALREKAGGQPPTEEMRETFRQLRGDRDTKLKAILTADQFARLQEMMSQQGQGQGRGEQRRSPDKPK